MQAGSLTALAGAVAVGGTPAAAYSAPPASEARVAVLPLVGGTDLPSDFRANVGAQVRKALEDRRYTVVEGRSASFDCSDAACIRAAADAANAEYVVLPSLSAVERDYGIAVRVYDPAGNLKASEEDVCEICSYDEAVEAFGQGAGALRDPLAGLLEDPYAGRASEGPEATGPATLAFRTDPAGAAVKIDGKRVGKTPLKVQVQPGLRDVAISLRNYTDVVETVRAARGQTDLFAYELVENGERRTLALRITGWTFSMVGVALLGGGVTLLALEERPVRNDCSGSNVDFNGNCRYRYDTLLPGALLTGFGLASLLTGITTGVIAYGRRSQSQPNGLLDTMDEDKISGRPTEPNRRITGCLGPTGGAVRVRF